MVSPTEFLTKQLTIEKEIVTFRSLSRALSIHVNVAKNELASFHASSKAADEPVHATFLLTGDVAPVSAYGSYRDESQMDADDDELETVSTTKILLVNEDELEGAKAQFTRLSSVHIYSLSPASIKDAALLAPAADRMRSQYTTKGKEFYQLVGIVIGADVKVNALAPKKGKANIAASSKLMLSAKAPIEKPKSSENTDSVAGTSKPQEKKTKGGTLDWSKAKSKAEKEKELVAAKAAKKDKEKAVAKKESKEKDKEKSKAVSNKESKADLKKKGQDTMVVNKKESEESNASIKKEKFSEMPKRGRKRPSALLSLSDSEEDEQDSNPAPKTKPRTSTSSLSSKPASTSEKGLKVKKGVLISDDEDETSKSKPSRQKGKGKGRAVLSEDEDGPDRSVRAMMDLDDSHFTRHNKAPAEAQEKEEEEEDVDMISDSEPIPTRAKPKKKPKKVVPVGRNGLPKKRIVKSKKSKDARGYTITVDYSSYESVSESEQVPSAAETEKKPKKGKKPAKKTEDSVSPSETPSNSKARPKPRPSNKLKAENDESSSERLDPTQADAVVKSEAKRPAISGGGKLNGAKPSNGSKPNLMSYFGKK